MEIIHRDLKPENMFLSGDQKRVILIDLGSSEDLSQPEIRKQKIDDNYKRSMHLNFVGTSQYMAPECAQNKGSSKKSDVWSLGCILFQLFTGLTPFPGKSDYLIFLKSTKAEYRAEEFPELLLPNPVKTLLKQIFNLDPE